MSEARRNADRLAEILGVAPIANDSASPILVTKGETGDYPLLTLYHAAAAHVLAAHELEARP